jgi:hypothetical protein
MLGKIEHSQTKIGPQSVQNLTQKLTQMHHRLTYKIKS